MILAELDVRHTRRHMPTRRVALDASYLPMTGQGHGAALLEAVVAENIAALDDEQLEMLPKFLHSAKKGLTVPRIALRYRLQTDRHGLDLSRHRIIGGDVTTGSGRPVLELDRHGPAAPQLIGAIMAAAALPSSGRKIAMRAIDAAVARPGSLPEGLEVRRMYQGLPGLRPYAPGSRAAFGPTDEWRGVPAERRWAMEVLGLRAGMAVDRDDVNRRFRRMLRDAHPDSGGAAAAAAARIAELTEARTILLELASSEVAAQG